MISRTIGARHRALALAALLLTAGSPAAADDGDLLTGTLKTIRDRGTILIGTRERAVPFSYKNKGGQPIGFSVDLCHGIAEDIAKALNRDLVEPDAPAWASGIRIAYVTVAPEQRLPKIVSGEIDLECGATTATAERAKTIAFSPVFFLAGTKLMVAKGSPITGYQSAAGKTVAVSTGTTNATVIKALSSRVTPPLKVTETSDIAGAIDMLAAGKADAFASDDILLSGLIALLPGGSNYIVTGDYLSYEPYAIGFRRDDPAFAAQVTASFQRMAQENVLTTLYRRWFTAKLPDGETLNLPMSAHLSEIYRALGSPD